MLGDLPSLVELSEPGTAEAEAGEAGGWISARRARPPQSGRQRFQVGGRENGHVCIAPRLIFFSLWLCFFLVSGKDG